MPNWMYTYVRVVTAVNYRVGRIAMYLIFVMMAILLWSAISKTFFKPSLITLELAQFTMVAYYLLGGPYSMQLGGHVRMDLVYGVWSDKTKAWVDAFTIFALIFYLCVLFYGAVSSSAYSLGYFGDAPFIFFKDIVIAFLTGGPAGVGEITGFLERNPSAWRPLMWPIKITAAMGIFLMLLQAIAVFFTDVAKIRGEEI